MSLLVGLIFNTLTFLGLSFFYLMIAASEFGVGIILLLLQHLLFRSLSLYENDVNLFKFINRFNRLINLNRLS